MTVTIVKAVDGDALSALERTRMIFEAVGFGGHERSVRPGIGNGKRRSRHQPATTGRHDDTVGPTVERRALLDDFMPGGPLARDDVKIVIGFDQGGAALRRDMCANRFALLRQPVIEHDLRTMAARPDQKLSIGSMNAHAAESAGENSKRSA